MLPINGSCVPTCDDGFVLRGRTETTCTAGGEVQLALCRPQEVQTVTAAVRFTGAIKAASFRESLLSSLGDAADGAIVTIDSFVQEAKAQATLPAAFVPFDSSKQLLFRRGVQSALGLNSVDDVTIDASSRRRRLQSAVTVDYTVMSTDPTVAESTAAAMSNTTTFAAALVTGVQTIDPTLNIQTSDISASQPVFQTQIDYSIEVRAGNQAAASALVQDTTQITNIVQSNKVPGTPDIAAVESEVSSGGITGNGGSQLRSTDSDGDDALAIVIIGVCAGALLVGIVLYQVACAKATPEPSKRESIV